MVEKSEDIGKAKGAKRVGSPATAKVGKGTPITVKKRDMSPRALGLDILTRFYLGETDLEMMKRRALRYENRTISDEEAVLAILTDMMRGSQDLQQKASLMEGIAEYQSTMGHDPRPVLSEMHKVELTFFKEMGFERVSLTCRKDACPHCKAHDGKVIPIAEALAKMPLPHPDCTKMPHSKARPFCRCRYYGEYIG